MNDLAYSFPTADMSGYGSFNRDGPDLSFDGKPKSKGYWDKLQQQMGFSTNFNKWSTYLDGSKVFPNDGADNSDPGNNKLTGLSQLAAGLLGSLTDATDDERNQIYKASYDGGSSSVGLSMPQMIALGVVAAGVIYAATKL